MAEQTDSSFARGHNAILAVLLSLVGASSKLPIICQINLLSRFGRVLQPNLYKTSYLQDEALSL